LPLLLAELRRVMSASEHDYEIIVVDDGSTDGTRELLESAAAADPRLKVLVFSRNFGHQVAITAALDHASGDAVAVIDADLQDPPDLLPDMAALLEQGFDVVSARRTTRKGDSLFKRGTARLFYWLMQKGTGNPIPSQVGDFRMFSRRAVIALRQLHERHRFMRGMVTWLGLRETILPYDRQPRIAGVTKYSIRKMVRFAWLAVSSFSAFPLRLSMYCGFIVAAGGVAYGAYSIYAAYVLRVTVPGWTSLIVLNVVFSGAILVAIGLVGDYLARVYEEAKGRPLYIVAGILNLPVNLRPANGVVLPPPPVSERAAPVPDSPYARSARRATRI
jgi:dolichol-phosphate mannosyltransferase